MSTTLPWFNAAFPLYLAPMAGVSDKIFRQICKRYGADVLVTEFVSAEGIFRRNERTRQYLDFESFFTHILAHELTHGIGPHQITINGRSTNPRL